MLEKIQNATREEISEILPAAMARYRELYPEWEIFYTSIEKSVDKNRQLNQMIALLEQMKEHSDAC